MVNLNQIASVDTLSEELEHGWKRRVRVLVRETLYDGMDKGQFQRWLCGLQQLNKYPCRKRHLV
jgi:hypothetical protein